MTGQENLNLQNVNKSKPHTSVPADQNIPNQNFPVTQNPFPNPISPINPSNLQNGLQNGLNSDSPTTNHDNVHDIAPSGPGLAIRRVSIPTENDWINLPNKENLGTTPGGTMFGMTPGGTRIMYDRLYLNSLKNSSLSMTPPCGIPQIPGVTYDIREQVTSEEEGEDENNNCRNGSGEGGQIKNWGSFLGKKFGIF